MNENTTTVETREDTPVKPEKMAYSRPLLRFYGSVAELTLAGTGSGVDGGITMAMVSDRSTKQNIVQIGIHPLGIGLYLFDYKPEFRDLWGPDRRLGVMADEVETVRPQAVSMHANGYKMVDYGMLN